MTSDRCVFCDIVAGGESSSRVHEDELVLAFMDLHPINPGHVLVVPKRHAAGLVDLDEELGAHMWRVGHRLARALRLGGVRCEGVNVHLADGEAAGQDVFHAHLHVFPRFAGDSFRIQADGEESDREELDRVAAQLSAALAHAVP